MRVILFATMFVTAREAQALNCKAARTRIDKAICRMVLLRKIDARLEAAFVDRLSREPQESEAIKAAQLRWVKARDHDCEARPERAISACLEARYWGRIEELTTPSSKETTHLPPLNAPPTAMADVSAQAIRQPSAAKTGSTQPPSVAPQVEPIGPGAYEAGPVVLQLSSGGEFSLEESNGSRKASGHYAFGAGALKFLDGTGDVGRTVFPLTCQVVAGPNGFTFLPQQRDCRAFAGMAFRSAA